MKPFLPASVALTLALGLVSPARADIAFPAPPPPVSSQKAKLVVAVDDSVKEAHLRIPQNLLPAAGKTEKGAEASAFGLPTVVAGVALTLAFVSGGFWLVRRGRAPASITAAVVLGLSLACLGASVALADIPRPPRKPLPPIPLPLVLPAGVQLSDNIVLDIVPKGEPLTLVVNKSMVLKTDKPEDK